MAKIIKTKQATSEKLRQGFAERMRSRIPQNDLKKIAAAFDNSYDRVQMGFNPDESFRLELARYFSGFNDSRKYQIRGIPFSYKQGQIIYDMVRFNKYGGLTGKVETDSKPNLDLMPDGCFPEIVRQSPEAYLREYESKLCSA